MENPFDDFFNYEPRKDLENFSKVPTETWLKLGEQKALENFQLAAKAVPAYKDFLRKNKITPEKIKTIEDFKHLPLTTKENYFTKYPLKDLALGGDLHQATVIHTSSGSTGKSFYWPKLPIQDINAYKGVELLFTYYFDIDRTTTLQITCFGLGCWAAGEIMHSSAKMFGDKGLKISVISPGLHDDLFFTFFKDLAKYYDQTIIAGYPSHLRILVNEGIKRGIDFKKYKVKILTGGESFSENWRAFMSQNLGFSKPHRAVAAVFGSAEIGVVSMSTPFVDSLRIFLSKNIEHAKKIFPGGDLPSLTQFIPPARHIELVEDQIVITSLCLTPLIRYNCKDNGQILSPRELLSSISGFRDEYASLNEPYGVPNLPILAVGGRSDGTITLYALNIYPEQILKTLETPSLEKYLTGRVATEKLETKKSEPYLKLTLELRSGVIPSEKLKATLQDTIAFELAAINSEYSHLLAAYGAKVKPVIDLKEYGTNDSMLKSGKGVVVRVRK